MNLPSRSKISHIPVADKPITKDELEQIQSICRQWMSEPTTNAESRLTIPSGIVLERKIVIKINALLTFDNVLVESAVDADTGFCYTKRIGESGKRGEFIDTPFEMIPVVQTEPARTDSFIPLPQEPAEKRSRPQPSLDVDSDPDQPKFLLYSNQTVLGYSLLEQTKGGNQRKGRFYPGDDYFDHAEVFAAFPQAENDNMEVNAREAYGLTDDNDSQYRNLYNELANKIEALQLYLADIDGKRIEAKEVRVEDLSHYYDDQRERWLYVTFAK